MTTETLSRPPPVTGVGHRGPESSEVDIFRDVGKEDRNTAENDVPTATTPGVSYVSPLDVALIDLAKEKALEESPASGQKDDQVEKALWPPAMPSEGIKMGDESNQLPRAPEVNDAHGPSSEQLKADDVPDRLDQEELDGHRAECHGETPDALSEPPHPAATSVSEEKEGRQPLHCPERDMAAPMDSPKELGIGQEAKGSPPAHRGDASGHSSERQNSSPNSAPLGLSGESSIAGSHAQTSVVGSGSLEETEASSSPNEAESCEDNSQVTLAAAAAAAAAVSPQSPCSVLPGPDSPSHPGEEDCCVLPSCHPSASASPAEPQGASPVHNIQEDRESGCSEMPTGEETSSTEHILLSRAPEGSPRSLHEHSLRKDSGGHLQATQGVEQVVQDTPCCQSGAPSSPGLSGSPRAVLDPSCQQRAAAAGTGWGDAAAQPAAFTRSPVATDGIFGPAHECDGGHTREEQASLKLSGGGGEEDTKPQVEAGSKAVEESEKGEEKAATRSPDPEGSKEPEGAKDLPSAKDLPRALPGLASPAGASDPSGPQEPPEAMVLASAEDLHEVRERAEAQELLDSTACPVPAARHHRGPSQVPREGSLLDPGDLAELPCTPPAADEPSAMEVSGCPAEWAAGATDGPQADPSATPETPIEREIRLHLEREELLRRERGLASPRGTQEYVEVRIRPILNQSGLSSTLPKEKERHWAGVQMQREIRRECQREEDLVQLGKVRGAYDRGTPIELQEKKMLFEQQFNPEPLASRKTACGSGTEGGRAPSFPEANHATNMVIVDSGALLRSQRPQLEKASLANPFFCLRAKSPHQSLLEQEVQEARERERELQRQRYSLYGSTLPCPPAAETTEHEVDAPGPPERPSCKKLDVTWPPLSSSETSQVNGPPQLERSPRILRRQRSALIERWESGAVGKQEDED